MKHEESEETREVGRAMEERDDTTSVMVLLGEEVYFEVLGKGYTGLYQREEGYRIRSYSNR